MDEQQLQRVWFLPPGAEPVPVEERLVTSPAEF